MERVVSEALLGAAVGVLTIVLARSIRGQRWLYSIGLLVLPSLYAIFALQAGEQAVGVEEMIYGIPFLVAGLVLAFVSVRHSAVVVGAFWMLHGVYDLMHSRLLTNPGVPDWYPVWCCSVDVVIGAYLVWLSRRVPNGNLRLADVASLPVMSKVRPG
jgi:uncharacterized membrane protein HdeD (DUF308 family)